jgi:hypothetical protein
VISSIKILGAGAAPDGDGNTIGRETLGPAYIGGRVNLEKKPMTSTVDLPGEDVKVKTENWPCN